MNSAGAYPKPPVTGYPAGTAYPYPAPPPSYPPPPPYYPPPPASYSPSPKPFLRRLIAIIVAVFLVAGAVTLIIWLVLRPTLPDVTLSSASLSAFNLSSPSQSLSADFNLSLSIQNRNRKMSISYYHVAAAAFYGADPVARTTLPPFYQPKRSNTTLTARMAAVGEYVGPDVVKGIEADRSGGGGVVRFHFRVFAYVRFRSGAWSMRRHLMRVYCEDVGIKLKNASSGEMVGPARQCQVNL